MAPPKLSDIEIQRELGTVSGWTRRGDAIVKSFTFESFPQSVAFVVRAGFVAEALAHHPDLDVRYTKVGVLLSTHDAGGVTELDFRLARALDAIAVGSP